MKEFVEMSKYAGMREDLVQAGGGNSSYKISPDKMVIKASGVQLSDVREDGGFSVVNPQVIINAFSEMNNDKEYDEEEGKRIIDRAFIEGAKPSIETFLHALSGRFTLHTHPILVNAIVCRNDAEKIIELLFPESVIVPYATPGISLAAKYFKAVKDRKNDVVFLLNHGVVVSGDTAEIVMQKTEAIVDTIADYLQVDYTAYKNITNLWKCFKNKIVWKVEDKSILEVHKKYGIWNHLMCPDCVVYLGKKIIKIDDGLSDKDIDDLIEKYGEPSVVEYKNELYILADSYKKIFEIQSVLMFSASVYALNEANCKYLTEHEIELIQNMEAEKYRKKL